MVSGLYGAEEGRFPETFGVWLLGVVVEANSKLLQAAQKQNIQIIIQLHLPSTVSCVNL
jgi:hypothetical protein